jgi:hypothetical protein
MVGVEQTVDTSQDVLEEGPGRIHGLAGHIHRVRFTDPGLHLLELFQFIVSQDPAREADVVRVPVPVQPFVARHRIRHELQGTDSPFQRRALFRRDKDDHRRPGHAFTSDATVAG